MAEEMKQVPASEVSLKYMAWNVKEITACMKDICKVLMSIDLAIKDLNQGCQKKQNDDKHKSPQSWKEDDDGLPI
jgi:hypothetical protein